MIADYNLEQDLDICCLTETWLNADDPVTIGELCPNGYKLISIPSKDRCGGGVAVVVKEPLSVEQNCPDDVAFHSFEHLTTIITHPQHSQPFNFCIVYRPPRSDKNTTPANAGVVDCHLLSYRGPAVIGETCISVPLPTGKKLNKS